MSRWLTMFGRGGQSAGRGDLAAGAAGRLVRLLIRAFTAAKHAGRESSGW
jgi:hypothetical protein